MTRPRKEETICTKQFGFEVTVLTQSKTDWTPQQFPQTDPKLFARRKSHGVSVRCARWTARFFRNTETCDFIRFFLPDWVVLWLKLSVIDGLNRKSSVTFEETLTFWILWNNKAPQPEVSNFCGSKILTTYCFFFYGSIKFWWTCDQNFMDPQNFGGNEIKILWIHKILTVYWSFFCGSTKFWMYIVHFFMDP